MPKASLTLANGTVVTIEGTAPEVHELLAFYGSSTPKPANGQAHKPPVPPAHQKPAALA